MVGRSRLVGLLLGLVFTAAAAVAPVGAAASPSAPTAASTSTSPLPACSYQDVLTSRTGYADWDKTLLDPIYMVSSTYVPPDLRLASDAGITGGGKVRSIALADLRAMTAAAKAASRPIKTTSAYRSYATQASLFNSDVTRLGYDEALLHTARPGHSEHQLGTTVDFGSKKTSDTSADGDWAHTRAGRWMATNAWKYGWIMSYPFGKTALTCYNYEPWHYRYVGRTAAAQVVASGLTLREWLWQQGYGEVATTSAGAPLADAA